MGKTVFAVLLVAVGCVSGVYTPLGNLPEDGRIRVVSDEMTGRTSVYFEAPAVGSGYNRMGGHGVQFYEAQKKPGLYIGQVWKKSDTWRYLKCHEVTIRADGDLFEFEGEQSGDSGSGARSSWVTERVLFPADRALLTKLGNASNTRIRVCNTMITLTPGQKSTLLKFLEVSKRYPAGATAT